MDNAQIADRLEVFASLLELAETNPYTARAYSAPPRRSAARRSRSPSSRSRVSIPGPIPRSSRARPDLKRLVETGAIAELAELERELAPDLAGLGRYLGLNAKRSVELARAVGVRTAEELREAAAADRSVALN